MALASIAWASPAAASTGLICSGVDSAASVSTVLGSGLARTTLAARLVDERGERRSIGPGQSGADALVIGQTWLDRSEYRLDLLDVEGRTYVARLRVRFLPEGPTLAVGTLVLGTGRVVEVECRAD